MSLKKLKRRQCIRGLGASASVGAITGLAGCAGGGGDDGETDGLTTVDKLQTEGSLTVPVDLAGIEQGTYEEQGINLEHQSVGYGRYAGAITGGDSLLNPLNFAIYMNAHRDDSDIIFVNGESKLINGIFTPEDSDIETPADFEGKTIGIPPRDSGTSMLLTSMIQTEYGYELDEIAGEVIETGPTQLWNLMNQDEGIDAMMQFGSFTVQGRAEGSGLREIFDPDEWWQDRTGFSAQISFYGTTREWLDENADTALSVLRGWDSAREYILDNTEAVIDEYGSAAGFNEPEEKDVVIEEMQDRAILPVEDWDEDYAQNQLEMLDLLVENGFYESRPTFDEGVVTFSELQDLAE